VIRERDIQTDRRSRSSCQLGHAGYAAESLVRARLSHRCLPSNKRGAHWVGVCVCVVCVCVCVCVCVVCVCVCVCVCDTT
jgi:hypothetical protein